MYLQTLCNICSFQLDDDVDKHLYGKRHRLVRETSTKTHYRHIDREKNHIFSLLYKCVNTLTIATIHKVIKMCACVQGEYPHTEPRTIRIDKT